MAKNRRHLYPEEAKLLGLEVKPNERLRNNAKYTINDEDWETVKAYRTQPKARQFVETVKKLNADGEILSTIEKLQSEPIPIPEDFEIIKISTSKTTGQQWIQYAQKKQEEVLKEIDFEAIIKKHIKPIKITPVTKNTVVFTFDRLVYTDVHIGMTTNENGHSLYGGKWDEEEILSSLDTMISHVLENQKSNVLIIDELGDFLDGYDGETVRKGHKLPQNMDNEKAFDVGLYFKCKLVDTLALHYEKVICNNICNDNHAGSFGYLVNSAFEKITRAKYTHVEINNYRKFINHYFYANNCFIISHGKDGKNLKFGFKPILDPVQIEKIKNYIDQHYLLREGVKIEFSKGDSHQKIFDETTSEAFDYYNYLAFSPASEWVQTNFKKGVRGFEFFNFKENGQKVHNPHLFDWNTNREEISIDFCL